MPGARTGSRVRVAATLALGLAVPAPPPHAHTPSPTPIPAGAAESHVPPEIAPDFLRMDLAGHPVRLSSYRGKLVLLSFWATWCEPCRAEAPRFSGWQQKYGSSGLQVLGISMDDDPAPVADFVRQLHLAYPIVMGDAQLAELFGGVLGLPLAFLIDPTGRIVARYRGEPDLNRVEAQIKASLPASRQ
jgi:cytochrome c biogenesis protein CcmG/thiol:disulfide interchange protein DsbE